MIAKTERSATGSEMFLNLLKNILNLFVTVVAYGVSLLYSSAILFVSTSQLRTTVLDVTILVLTVCLGFCLSWLIYRVRPREERTSSRYKAYFLVSLLTNTVLGTGACLYALNALYLYPISLPGEEFLPGLYSIVITVVTIFLFPLSLLIFIYPAILIASLLVKIRYRTQAITPAVMNQHTGSVALVFVFVVLTIIISQLEAILGIITQYIPYLVGSIPIYWIYFFLINPWRRKLLSKIRLSEK